MSLYRPPESQSDPDNFPAPSGASGSDTSNGGAVNGVAHDVSTSNDATSHHHGIDKDEPHASALNADTLNVDAAHEARSALVPSAPQGARVARDSLGRATVSETMSDALDTDNADGSFSSHALDDGDVFDGSDALSDSTAAATAAAFRKSDDFTSDDLVAGAFDNDAPETEPLSGISSDAANEISERPTIFEESHAAPLADDNFDSSRGSDFHDAFDSGPDDGGATDTASAGGGYGGPPLTAYGSDSAFVPDPVPYPAPDAAADKAARDKEQDLFEHLGELRKRLLHCVVAVMIVMVGTWNYGNQISEWFIRPVKRALSSNGGEGRLQAISPTEPFTIYLTVTLVAALMIAMPYVLYQIWRFIEPALTREERRYGLVLVPFAIILFFGGVSLGYALSPLFYKFFLQFNPFGVENNWSYGQTVAIQAKMLLVFGICFQVPVVVVFVNKVGLVSRNWLIEYWRHVVVVMFIVVAIITPTWDPITLTAAALPPCLLYAFSIWLIKWL